MRQYQPEPRTYELMTILSPEVADDDLQGQIDAIAGYVTGAGGEVMDVNRDSPWGRRRLTYAIRHSGRDIRDGYYALFHLRLEPRRVIEVERDIKLNDQILRYLVTQYEPRPVDETAVPAEGAQPTAVTESPTASAPASSPEAAPPIASAAPQPEAAAETTTEPDAAAEPETAADVEAPTAMSPASAVPVATSEATDDQPQVATKAGTEEQAGQSPATTPGEEPENPPAQPDATPKEE